MTTPAGAHRRAKAHDALWTILGYVAMFVVIVACLILLCVLFGP